jgi:hypothetical protein
VPITSDVMVDFETLDTANSAVLVSLGAAKFNLKTGELDNDGFYAVIDIDSCLREGRTVSQSTLLWWLKQPPEARAVFHDQAKSELQEVLSSFTAWLGHADYRLWGNGPSFDLGKLAHAYQSFGMATPWKFYNERCVRTYRALPGAEAIPKVAPAIAHHALYDAVAQAEHVMQIHQALFTPASKRSKK